MSTNVYEPSRQEGPGRSGPWTIVCFAGVDWQSHRQRPQALMASFAEQGHRVLYIDNLGTRMPRPADARRVLRRLANWLRTSRRSPAREDRGVKVDSPVVLPLQHLTPVRWIGRVTLARRLRRRVPTTRPLVIWTYLPLPVISDVARALDADLLVYDWADDAAEHVLTRSKQHRRRISRWEDEMAGRADLLLVASAELLRRRGSPNHRTFVVPHGVQSVNDDGGPLLPIVAGSRHPRVGLIGSISEWIDIGLLDRLAEARPGWSFIMVGPIKTKVDRLRRRQNVILTGERPYEEIPTLLSSLDAAVVPYRVAPAIEAASPVKLREYLAFGLPVVSVDIPEVRPFVPPVEVASGPNEFLDALERAVVRGRRPPDYVPPTWDDTAQEIAGLIERALAERSAAG